MKKTKILFAKRKVVIIYCFFKKTSLLILLLPSRTQGPEAKMVVLHDFTPCVDDELEVKRGQVRVVLKCKISNTHTLCFPAFSPRFSSEKL